MAGFFEQMLKFPFVPGTDGAGHVVKAGKNAEHLIGKRVVLNGGLNGCWS